MKHNCQSLSTKPLIYLYYFTLITLGNLTVLYKMKLQTCKCLSFLTIDFTLASPCQHSPDLASLHILQNKHTDTEKIALTNKQHNYVACILHTYSMQIKNHSNNNTLIAEDCNGGRRKKNWYSRFKLLIQT